MTLLQVRDLRIRAEDRALVRGATFSVAAGRTLALIGGSGSGKSLTALALMRLLPAGLTIAPDSRVTFVRLTMLAGG